MHHICVPYANLHWPHSVGGVECGRRKKPHGERRASFLVDSLSAHTTSITSSACSDGSQRDGGTPAPPTDGTGWSIGDTQNIAWVKVVRLVKSWPKLLYCQGAGMPPRRSSSPILYR